MTDRNDDEIAEALMHDILYSIQYFSSSVENMKLESNIYNNYPADYLIEFDDTLHAFKQWTDFYNQEDVKTICSFGEYIDTYPCNSEDYLWSYEGIDDARWVDIRARAKKALNSLSKNDEL